MYARNTRKLTAIVAILVAIFAIGGMAIASNSPNPVSDSGMGDGTGILYKPVDPTIAPGGSPEPIFETPIAVEPTAEGLPFITPVPIEIREMPNTGAGTTAKEFQQSNHTYTTSSLWCRKFAAGIYYLSETFTRWQDNWWGSGHYAAYSWTVNYSSRCYVG